METFCQNLIVSNFISAFLNNLNPKFFSAGQPWWLTYSTTHHPSPPPSPLNQYAHMNYVNWVHLLTQIENLPS